MPNKPRPVVSKQTPAQNKLLGYIREQGQVSVAMVMEYMGCSRSTAMRYIGALLEQGLICKLGEHKNVRYIPV